MIFKILNTHPPFCKKKKLSNSLIFVKSSKEYVSNLAYFLLQPPDSQIPIHTRFYKS